MAIEAAAGILESRLLGWAKEYVNIQRKGSSLLAKVSADDEPAGGTVAVIIPAMAHPIVTMARPILRPYEVDPECLQAMFGDVLFCIYRDNDAVFHKFCVKNWPVVGIINLFHGMTLGELTSLLSMRVWTAGRYTQPSVSSPLAIWGCTTIGMAIDRAAVERGWAFTHNELPSAWDCPVVLGMSIPEDYGYGQHKRLTNGSSCMRKLVDSRNIPFDDLNIVTVFVPREMYSRFNRLRSAWTMFQSGEAVLCRTRRFHVEDFWKSGHGSAWSCGRWVPFYDAPAMGWKKANETKQWRCPMCDKYFYDNVSVVGVQ